MFCRNEKVVYPGYGVAVIQDIIAKQVLGKKSEFLQLKFMNKEITILVPMEKTSVLKLRKLLSPVEIESALASISSIFPIGKKEEKVLTATWSKRQKEYLSKIQSGDIKEIGLMYCELKHIEMQKELSFGEKTLLLQVEDLLTEELSISKDCKYAAAKEVVRDLICIGLSEQIANNEGHRNASQQKLQKV